MVPDYLLLFSKIENIMYKCIMYYVPSWGNFWSKDFNDTGWNFEMWFLINACYNKLLNSYYKITFNWVGF